MALTTADKARIMSEHQAKSGDTGSSEVQIALLTARIEDLSNHLSTHKKDNHSRYGLIKLVSQRKRLLNYLKNISVARYLKISNALGLRTKLQS